MGGFWSCRVAVWLLLLLCMWSFACKSLLLVLSMTMKLVLREEKSFPVLSAGFSLLILATSSVL